MDWTWRVGSCEVMWSWIGLDFVDVVVDVSVNVFFTCRY
ncbi:hypothetical protein ES702_03068 [subsurface metagenome]